MERFYHIEYGRFAEEPKTERTAKPMEFADARQCAINKAIALLDAEVVVRLPSLASIKAQNPDKSHVEQQVAYRCELAKFIQFSASMECDYDAEVAASYPIAVVADNSCEPWLDIGSSIWTTGVTAWREREVALWRNIQEILDEHNIPYGFFVPVQMKEKFSAGILYWEWADGEVIDAFDRKVLEKASEEIRYEVSEFENDTLNTCQICGDVATHGTRGGWYSRYCAVCYETLYG